MKTNFKHVICLVMVLAMLSAVMPFGITAADEPVITVDNYTVTITNADSIKDMRYALGEYTTTSEIRAAEGNVALSNAIVTANTADGIFVYEMPKGGYYTIWIRMQDGTNYIKPLDLTSFTPYVSSYGVKVTLHNLYDVKDFFIAKGEFDSYSEIKTNGYIFNATAAKIGDKHDYTYTVTESGVHTVLIRYNDGTSAVFHETLVVDEPVFTENGLQVIVSNIPDVKVIRTAYGEWSTTKELKATDTIRNFSAKTAIKGKDPYTIQYRDDGVVTVIVEYNNGYIKTYHYEVQHREPVVTQNEGTVTFSELDGLLHIRYAQGEYTTASEIKAAEGSVKIKAEEAVDGIITVTLEAGIYTFCVQYNDESYNYYTITVEEKIPEPCAHIWGEWEVSVPATEEAEGVEIRTCTLCSETETRAIPKLEPTVVTPTATRVNVSCAFSDNMILQRDEKLSVWGNADALSGDVVVSFGGKTASAPVDRYGNWKATFKDTFSYTTEGQPLTISGADYSITFNDVLIGDVYYAIGQSNIYYSMGELMLDLRYKGMENTLSVDFDNNRDIRFYRISNTDYVNMAGIFAQGTTTLYTDVYNGGYWMMPTDIAMQILTYANFTPTSETYERTAISSKCFSALGYMFAYNMSIKSDVPVGVIEIDASGQPLITFAPNELADKWGHDTLGADGRYFYYLDNSVYNTTMRTRYAYNQQIYPLSGFSCAGIIWYQGESDMYNTKEVFGRQYNNNFPTQFTELMTYFRSTFGNDDFPVYIIEYPTCYNGPSVVSMDFGGVRSELGTIPQMLDNSYIVSSSDLWYDSTWWNNVHPYIKHWQASRLADIVAANKFSMGDLDDVCGPVLSEVKYVSNSKAELKFDHVGTGLTTADGTGIVKGIEIQIDLNGQLVWITHQGKIITGTDTITVDAGTFTIYGVRYNRNLTDRFPIELNLCNSYKMPAIAFVDYRT